MKVFLVTISMMFCFGVFAAPGNPVDDEKQADARKIIFNETKTNFLKVLDEHAADIVKTKECANNAKDMDALKLCKKMFRESERAIHREQRQRIIKKFKKKGINHLKEHPPKI